jgi:hypothetical protein
MSRLRATCLSVAALLAAPCFASCGSSHASSSYPSTASQAGVQLAVVAGDKQTGTAGAALPLPLVVAVTDASNDPVAGASVAFAVPAGSLSVTNAFTDSQGHAQTMLTLGASPGPATVTVTLGVSGPTIAFTAVALAPGASQVSASPASFDFGNTGVGNVVSAAITLTNDGADSVTISQASVAGAGFGAAAIALPLTLPAGQSVSVSVTFAPPAFGGATGALTVVSSGIGSPTTIALAGTGVKFHYVDLSWNASTTPTVVGYNVYRGTVSGGPYQRINAVLVSGTTYRDTAVQAGMTYYYVTSSVDASGAESVFSNETVATIPTP